MFSNDICMQMEPSITFIMWHGGSLNFTAEGNILYESGEMCVWDGIPRDEFNTFDIENMGKTHGYLGFHKIWWRNPQVPRPHKHQLREVLGDHDIVSMTSVSIDNNGEIEIYFEHSDTIPITFIPPPVQTTEDDELSVKVIEPMNEPVAEEVLSGEVRQSIAPVDVIVDDYDEEDWLHSTHCEKWKGKAFEKVTKRKGKGKTKVASKGKGKA